MGIPSLKLAKICGYVLFAHVVLWLPWKREQLQKFNFWLLVDILKF